jgi:hypothetical protein
MPYGSNYVPQIFLNFLNLKKKNLKGPKKFFSKFWKFFSIFVLRYFSGKSPPG